MRWLVPGTAGYRLWSLLAGWPRWVAAGGFACAALAIAVLSPATASRGPTVDVVVAAQDLPAGAALGQGSVRVAQWPAGLRPPAAFGSISAVTGRRTGAPLARGEPITPARILDTAVSGWLQSGDVAVTVTLAQPSLAAIVSAGSRIDLYSTEADGANSADVGTSASPRLAATVLARNVLVIAVLPPASAASGGSNGSGPSLVIACDNPSAARLAGQGASPVLASLRAT